MSTKKDGSHRSIYNITVSSECYRDLQHMKIDDGLSIPEICSKIIEKFTSKRSLSDRSIKSSEGSNKIIEVS